MDNVISLCGVRREVEQSAEQTFVDDAMSTLLCFLQEGGYHVTNEHDLGLICETITSALHRSKGTHHSLQELAEQIIVIT